MFSWIQSFYSSDIEPINPINPMTKGLPIAHPVEGEQNSILFHGRSIELRDLPGLADHEELHVLTEPTNPLNLTLLTDPETLTTLTLLTDPETLTLLTEPISPNVESIVPVCDHSFPPPNSCSSTRDNKPRIVILLDESGSMDDHREEMVKAINEFIDTQKNDSVEPCNLTLITFDHIHRVIIDDVPLADVHPLTRDNYNPYGMTALYDVMGAVMGSFQEERNIIMVIVTDGLENSSEKFLKPRIAELVSLYTSPANPDGWNIIYLASDPLLQAQGNELNIIQEENSRTSNCAVDFRTLASFARLNLSAAVSNFRKGYTAYVNVE